MRTSSTISEAHCAAVRTGCVVVVVVVVEVVGADVVDVVVVAGAELVAAIDVSGDSSGSGPSADVSVVAADAQAPANSDNAATRASRRAAGRTGFTVTP